jgi:hypothetical protein
LGHYLEPPGVTVDEPERKLNHVATASIGSTCSPGAWRPSASTQRNGFQEEEEITVSATLKLTHKAIGAEVRRGTYDVEVDGKRVGSVEMNDTIETPVEPGHHTLQVRDGRNSSHTKTFDAADGEIVAFRCTGKRFLPLFLASFVVPNLALVLIRE